MHQNCGSYRLTVLSSVQRNNSEQHQNLKYLIIDSQRGEQQSLHTNPCSQSPENTNSICFNKNFIEKNQNYHLPKIIYSTEANLATRQNSIAYDVPIDKEIADAQKEVQQLERECRLLQKIINDMAQEQAKIIVQIRVKDRRKSLLQKQNRQENPRQTSNCPIHPINFIKNSTSQEQINTVLVQRIPQNRQADPKKRKKGFSTMKSSLLKQRQTLVRPNKGKKKLKLLSKCKSKCLMEPRSQRKVYN